MELAGFAEMKCPRVELVVQGMKLFSVKSGICTCPF